MNAHPVLTLDDLRHWEHGDGALAVLGKPIAHSLSPEMQNAALRVLAARAPQFASWRYFRFEIDPADLPEALVRFHERRFRGLNLTVPHKVQAFPLVAAVDPAARPIAAVNTLRWEPAGWAGFNTDGYGLAQAIREKLGRGLAGENILLLGAGGAARAAAAECLERGCAALTIANRSPARIEELRAALGPVARQIPFHAFDPRAAPGPHLDHAVVINATSVGLHPADGSPLDLATIPKPAGVFDMIYNPPETPLLRQARERGLPRANGLAMLVHQGARALEIWTGESPGLTAPAMANALAGIAA